MKPSAAQRLERIFEGKRLDATVARSSAMLPSRDFQFERLDETVIDSSAHHTSQCLDLESRWECTTKKRHSKNGTKWNIDLL